MQYCEKHDLVIDPLHEDCPLCGAEETGMELAELRAELRKLRAASITTPVECAAPDCKHGVRNQYSVHGMCPTYAEAGLTRLQEEREDEPLEIVRLRKTARRLLDERRKIRRENDAARKAITELRHSRRTGGEMTEWISVEDRLPDTGRNVWIHPPIWNRPVDETSLDVRAATYHHGEWWEGYGYRLSCRNYTPTHWAEIDWPDPLEEAK